MLTRLRILGVAAAVSCLPLTVFAQDLASLSADEAPASLAYVDGVVDLDHDGLTEPATVPALLVPGDRVRTDRGRAELVYGDGSVLHLDEYTEIELLDPVRIRLLEGRVLLHASAAATGGYLIDTPASSVTVDARGEYVLSVDGRRGSLDVAVARGVAELTDSTGQRVLVRGGEVASLAAPDDRPDLRRYNTARWDSFERWSNDRMQGFSAADSAERLPTELRAYGPTLDHYGRWDYLEPHGYVWYPSTPATWRPYYEGGWRLTRYGWTWHGADPWAWPTHHYGRWGYSGRVWYWIPARTWGPAWVSWGFSAGYVSWAPLGWNGRPVISLNVVLGRGWDPWRAWTVIPRHRFGHRGRVRAWAIDPHRSRDFDRRSLVARTEAPPVPAGHAVPRQARRADASGAPRDVAVPRAPSRRPVMATPVGSSIDGRRPAGTTAADSLSRGRSRDPRGAVPRFTQPRNGVGSIVGRREVEESRARARGAVRAPRAAPAAREPASPFAPDIVTRPNRRRAPDINRGRDLTPRTRDRAPGAIRRDPGQSRDLTPRTGGRPAGVLRRDPRGSRDVAPRTGVGPPRVMRRDAGESRVVAPRSAPRPGASRRRPPSAGPSHSPGPSAAPMPRSSSPGAVRRPRSSPPPSAGAPPQNHGSTGQRSGATRRPNRRPPG